MKQLWIPLICMLFAGTALAESPAKTDFAYGAEIRLEDGGPLYSVAVDAHLYRHVTSPALADIRVFDSEGKVIPHTVSRTRVEKEEPAPPAPLPIFPLFERGDSTPDRLTVRFDTDPNGAILDLQRTSDAGAETKIRGYLVDMSALQDKPNTLEVLWEQDRPSGIVAKLRVEESGDLTVWRALVPEATVVTMVYGGKRLEQRDIDLPVPTADYLRLLWVSPEAGPELSGVLAHFPEKDRELPLQSIAVSGRRVDAPDSLLFDTQGRFPVDRVNLRLSEENHLLDVVLKSRPDRKAPWRLRYKGIFYSIRINGTVIENVPAPVPDVTDRYWRLEVLSGGLPQGAPHPEMEFQWYPHEVVFLSGGKPPFLLAYGNAEIENTDQPVRELLKSLKDRESDVPIASAFLGSPITLGGEARLRHIDPGQWKRWILWALLILSVLLLAWMAWRLYRQMAGTAS